MPFAGYPNFQACVRDNQDKKNPEAFCAWLEKQTTGKQSSELTEGLPATVKAKFWQSFDGYMENEKDEAKAMEFAVKAASELGWIRQKHGWMRKAEHRLDTQSVYGVPIFAAGTHNGDEYTINDLKDMVKAFNELKGRLDPPVKIGHTSDEFNKALAKKMGIEPELIKGENGNGVMAFGWVDALRVDGQIIYADLADVPKPIAELIESKSYKPLSAEVLFGFEDKGKKYPRVLSALALLGAELPAVPEANLETAAVYVMSYKPDSVIEFALDIDSDVTYEMLQPALSDMDEAIERQMKGKAGVSIIRAMWREVKGKVKNMLDAKKHSLEDIPPEIQAFANEHYQGNVDALLAWVKSVGLAEYYEKALLGKLSEEDLGRIRNWLEAKTGLKVLLEEEKMNKEFLAELGLDEQAKDEDVIAALQKLKDKGELKAMFSALGLAEDASVEDAQVAITALKTKAEESEAGSDEAKGYANRISVLEKDNKDLKRLNRIAHYKGVAGDLKAISGTPDELAEELVSIEEAAGEETVKKLVTRYQDQNKRLIAAGVFKAKGTSADGDDEDEHEFTKKVKAHMEEKHVDEPTAFAELRNAEPTLYKDFMAKRRVVTRAAEGSED